MQNSAFLGMGFGFFQIWKKAQLGMWYLYNPYAKPVRFVSISLSVLPILQIRGLRLRDNGLPKATFLVSVYLR